MITTNRGMILKTLNEKGVPYVSELALQNCKDLLVQIQFNHEHNIRLFRLSSDFFPWGDADKYTIDQLPDFEAIKAALAEAGALARLYDQRLTAHPSEFVKLAAPRKAVVDSSIRALEMHSLIFDLMGYEPNLWNKCNIHVGGTYEDKVATLKRFASNFQRLSDNCKKRLAVENDDRGIMYSVADLMYLHQLIGIPITFDFHHHKFCTGDLTEEQAFKMAIATWPKDVRPMVHWSESPEDPAKPRHAHSDFIKGPMNLYGHEADIDVMVEAKSKEETVLAFRKHANLQVELPAIPMPPAEQQEAADKKEEEAAAAVQA
jgi:UV DNA damage endonuclease